MPKRVIIDGYETDRDVAALSELVEAVRKWRPELSDEDAHLLLVKPPFELGRVMLDGEADLAAEQLAALGLRIRTLPVVTEDPTWWRERDAVTRSSFGEEGQIATVPPTATGDSPEKAAPPPANMLDIWLEIITQPSRFFASDLVRRGGGHPLIFAVLVSVIGAVMAVPGNYILGSAFGTGRPNLSGELLAAVLGTPFATLLFLVVASAFLHVAARMFGGDGQYGVGLRILAYTTAVSVFQAVPVIGHFFMMACYILFSLAGLQGAYGLSPVRAGGALMLLTFGMVAVVGMISLLLVVALGVSQFQNWIELFQ